jgi:c(7)-type cytochrome triheme protein
MMAEEDRMRCERCHSPDIGEKSDTDFLHFAQPLPKERFGNGLNWQEAEESGLINPVDFIKGISMRRKPLAVPKEKENVLLPKVVTMPGIIFSHQKHTVWNGCEVCHPDIFVSVKKGETNYSMSSIFQGKSCGVCHTSVAFPLTDCQRCHSTPVAP